MGFDIGAGLSALGGAVAQTAGSAALEAQKADLDNQRIALADQLAGAREHVGRVETGLINQQAADKQRDFEAGQTTVKEAGATGRTILSNQSEETRTGMAQSGEDARQAAGFAHADSLPGELPPGTTLYDKKTHEPLYTSPARPGTTPASQAFSIWHAANPDATPEEVIAKANELKTSSSGIGGGMKARYDQNMIRSGSEIVRTLGMLDNFPSGTSAGVFGNKGSGENISSWLSGKMRDEDQTDFNSAFAGVDQEMGNLLRNGLGVSDSTAHEMVAGFKPVASDTNYNRIFKLANMAAKAKVAAESTFPVDAEAKTARNDLVQKLDAFPTPEEVRRARLSGATITADTFGDAMRQIKQAGAPPAQPPSAASPATSIPQFASPSDPAFQSLSPGTQFKDSSGNIRVK